MFETLKNLWDKQLSRFYFNSQQVYYLAFVGKYLPATPEANPGDEMVIELSEFKLIAEKLRATLNDICKEATLNNLPQVVLEKFKHNNLLWPALYEKMQKVRLSEIKNS